MTYEQQNSKLQRLFEIIPGLLTWVVLSLPIWLGIVAPGLVALILTFLSIYWVYLAGTFTIGLITGYRKYKQEIAMDWFKKCEELNFDSLPEKTTLPKSLAEVKHFLLIPMVNEPYPVLDTTFKSIADQNYKHKENIVIVASIEERGAVSVIESLERLKEKYKDAFKEVLVYVHPAGIPGELVGGGAPNRTWGAKHAIEDLKSKGYNLRDFIFTTFDADTSIHKEFLARLTYEYLICNKRDNYFYSTTVFLFNNNIWNVHPLMRIEANSVTMGVLSSWSISGDTKETFSCYSTSLDTLIAADYWDVGLIDDTVFFWRAFFARKGDFKPKTFHVPNSSDAVHADTFLKAHVSLYKQLLRWGWGSITTPLALTEFVRNKEIPLSAKIIWAYNKAERHLIFRTIVFLITFGFAILSLVNENVRQTTIAYRLPNVISIISTFGLFFFIPSTVLAHKLNPPIPKEWPIWKKALTYLEAPLIVVNLLTFSFIPFLEAETKMMLGRRYKNLHFTPKHR